MKLLVRALVLLAAFQVGAKEQPKNVIMVVGDGMGLAATTGYRFYADDPATEAVETTVFDRHLVGMSSTHPAKVSGYVTDSAAGATALASGVKTYNGAIGMDVNKVATPTVLQWAKEKGMKTGVAVTSQVNHATPASYAVHNEYRRNYNEIADSYFDFRINDRFVLDVIFGGGWEYFIREDRNIVDEFKQAGYQYVDSIDKLAGLESGKPAIGLFADTGMQPFLDAPDEHRLLEMTKAAVNLLENDKGYFLLVEGSQIDWAEHANDAASTMAEMHDLALTLEWLEQYVAENPDTLVVITADHSTGGLTLGADGDYKWEPTILKQLNMSPRTIASTLADNENPAKAIQQYLKFDLTDDEKAQIIEAKGDGRKLFKALTSVLDERSNTGWTTSGHTAEDVQVFAMGKGKSAFEGHIDNTDIPKILFKMLGKH